MAQPVQVHAPQREPQESTLPQRSQQQKSSATAPGSVSNLPKMRKITFVEKCWLWIKSGKIQDRAQPSSWTATSSCGSRHYWTPLQRELLTEATRHLPFSSRMETIYKAILADEACQRHGITNLFTQQQIRDKFRNIVKKRHL